VDSAEPAPASDEHLTAAELRKKYNQTPAETKESSPRDAAAEASALRAAIFKVLKADARKRGPGSDEDPLPKKSIRRLVEAQLGLKPKALDRQRKEVNRLVEEYRERIFVAAFEGNAEEVESLVRSRANINAANKRGTVPLHIATTKAHSGVVSTLLAARAKPDTRMSNGWTPLLYAAWKGHDSIVSALISAGAQLNLRTQDGAVALTWAAREGHVNIIRALAHAKADPLARDRIQGMTPRQHAERLEKKEAAEILLELEERQAEEKKMAEFRARLQYPEGFDESESDKALPPAAETTPSQGGATGGAGDAKASKAHGASNDNPIPARVGEGPHVAIEIVDRNKKRAPGGAGGKQRVVSRGLSPDTIAAMSASGPLELLDNQTARFGEYVRKMFFYEAILTTVAAVIMFITPSASLSMFGIAEAPLIMLDCVPVVAVAVLVKGMVGARSYGRLTLEQVEVWLLSDLLYLYVVVGMASRHPSLWTIATTLSLFQTVMYAPIRIYWLVELRGYDAVPANAQQQASARPATRRRPMHKTKAEGRAISAGDGIMRRGGGTR